MMFVGIKSFTDGLWFLFSKVYRVIILSDNYQLPFCHLRGLLEKYPTVFFYANT